MEGEIMPQSSGSAPLIRSSQARWVGVITAALTVWLMMVWCIREVFIGLF
jgi:hypothetical protein